MKLNRNTVVTMLATPIVAVSTAFLQPDPDWTARYNGSADGEDIANGVAVDVFGNTIVTGRAEETGNGLDAVTRSYSPTGSLNWSTPFNSPIDGDDEGVALVVDKAGNTYVAVTSEGDGTGKDMVVLKIDPNGSLSSDWSSTGEGPGVRRYDHDESEEIAYDIALDEEGNVYVTGTTDGNGTELDVLVIKIKPDGTINPGGENWPAVYDGAEQDDVGRSIATDKDGHVVVAGYTNTTTTSIGDRWLLLRYESDGTLVQGWPVVWTYYGSTKGSPAFAVAVDNENGVYATGYSSTDSPDYQFVTAKWDEDGDSPVWSDAFDTHPTHVDESVPRGLDIVVESEADGTPLHVYATGVFTQHTTVRDYGTIKYEADSGDYSLSWAQVGNDPAGTRRYNGPGNSEDVAVAIAVIGRGSVYVTGRSVGDGTGYDYATIRYNEDGDEVWVHRFDHEIEGDDFGRALAMTIAGSVRVTGSSEDTGDDYLTLLFDEAVVENATSVSVLFGIHETGNLASLETDDGDRYEVREATPLGLGLPSVNIEIEFESSVSNPSELTIVVEANSSAIPAATQVVEIRDHVGSQWVVLDTRLTTTADRTFYLTPPGDPARYLDGNDAAQIRIKFFDPGSLFTFGWRGRIDMALMRVLE